MTPTAARVIYPELPGPLTPGDLQQLFSPSFDERQWAPTVARTSRVHADTHGQSAAVFGLAYLLGIELMPRIRRWQELTLYRSDSANSYANIDTLFGGTVNWALIREHYPQFMQLALAIQSGALAPSAVLARVNSYSTKNRFAFALKELGNAVRTTYLLEWVMDESLRRTVHKGTTKIERHHKFSKHLAFGAGGHLRSNDPADPPVSD